MPIYEYRCPCGHEEDRELPVSKSQLEKCPSCKKKKMERLISVSSGYVRQEAKTLGQLADRNAKKMGRHEVHERDCKKKELGKKQIDQAKVELNQKLRRMNNEQKTRWIEKGS